MSKQTTTLFAFTLVASLLLVACQVNKNPEPAATAEPVMEASPTADTTSPKQTMIDESSLPEGSSLVEAETTYQTPGGEEQVAFQIVIDETGVITDAKTQVMGKTPTTIMRQTSFAEEMPTVLKGKKLSELTEVDRIGGSSLTTNAFNKALADLKAQI